MTATKSGDYEGSRKGLALVLQATELSCCLPSSLDAPSLVAVTFSSPADANAELRRATPVIVTPEELLESSEGDTHD